MSSSKFKKGDKVRITEDLRHLLDEAVDQVLTVTSHRGYKVYVIYPDGGKDWVRDENLVAVTKLHKVLE